MHEWLTFKIKDGCHCKQNFQALFKVNFEKVHNQQKKI